MSYAMWLEKVDLLAALMTGGLMHDDLEYPWRDAFDWGEDPGRAALAASRGVQTA